MTVIVNYGAGNLRSVQKACEYIGEETIITDDTKKILSADHIILPGVGAFGDCMKALNNANLCQTLKTAIDNKTPFLGICLGLQLLFESSEETPNTAGLGFLEGECVKIPGGEGYKIPHIGWNALDFSGISDDVKSPLFKGIRDGEYVYFVHSYYMQPKDKSVISAYCNYSDRLPVALSRGNLNAVQFHPEKSGDTGLKILENFINM